MFKGKYLESGVIRIVIGILIFAALLSTAQAGDRPIFMNSWKYSNCEYRGE